VSTAAALAILGAACNDAASGPVAPTPFQLTVVPERQWSGGEIQLRAAVFDSVTLVPLPPDSTGIPRWANLTVRLGDDTLAVRRADDTTLVATLPDGFTGTYELRVTIQQGANYTASAELDMYGAHGPIYPSEITWADNYRITEAIPWPPGRLLTYFHQLEPVVIVDLADGTVEPPSGLSLTAGQPEVMGMLAPGVSYRAHHAVLDLGDTVSPPRTWQFEPELQPLEPTACAVPGARRPELNYSVAELPEGRCLGLQDVTLRIQGGTARVVNQDGTELVPESPGLYEAGFRIAPGGERVVLLAGRGRSTCFCALDGWTVFDGAAEVAYTISDYAQVPAAAFSPGGDTLYVVADLNFDPEYPSIPESTGPWVLDVRSAATGALLRRQELTGITSVYDVLADPVFPRLYVAARADSAPDVALLIIDRGTFAEVGRIRTHIWVSTVGMLVHGGTTGGVFLAVGDAGWDLGISIVRFDLMP